MKSGIFLSVFCMVGLSIVLSSCTNESKQKVSSREGIVDWISDIIAKNETDSLNPDKSTLEVSIEFLAVSKIDSSKSYFYDCGIISYPDNGTFSKLSSDTPSYEEHQYNTLPNDLYLAGGFSHEPDTVIMRDIHIGIEPIRDPISALCKKGYANYWQLKGEWPFFFTLCGILYINQFQLMRYI